MGEKEIPHAEMEDILPDILSAFMAGDVDVRVVVCFEVGPTGCFADPPCEGDATEALAETGLLEPDQLQA
jgi:hypothetical protein